MIVTAIDTHWSWHISFDFFVLGISKADIASVAGSLCRAIAVTSVCNFLCLKARYIWGASMHISTQLVVKYIMWAGVEVKNELFLGFSLLVCQTIGKKGKLGVVMGLGSNGLK